jgi:FKBP-type peptidyl-prolyl cis-trans isomerase FklB
MQFERTHRIDQRAADAEPSSRLQRGGPLLAVMLTLALAAGCETDRDAAPPSEPVSPESSLGDDSAKASYSLGYRFAENVQNQFPEDIESEAFVRGVRDQLAGKDAAVDEAEAERVLTAMMEARQAQAANESLETLEAGLAYLEENAKRDEVTALESGLQYEVLEEGEGGKPEPTDTVTTHYEGRLIDGTVFDSSYQRGEPATFPLNRVIAGWTEGLQLMSPGAKYRLYVPADLAYGDRAAGSIPPNSTLIFDVELLEVAAAEQGAGSGETSDQP